MRAARPFLYSQVRIVAAMLLGCFVFAGCQSAPVTEAKPPSIKVAVASEDGAPRYTFGIIYPVAHLFYEEITRLAEEAAAPHSIQLIVKAPESFSADQQIHMMETMIQQKVDAIAIAPIDAAALAPVIDRAVEAGIPVICFESDSPGSRRLSLIGTDNVKAGEQMGQVIRQLHNNKGMLLIESGVQNMKVNQERLDGLLQYLQNHTNIQVLEIRYHGGNSDKALSDLEQMIDDHPHFDSLVSVDLISSSASVLVWKAKGLNRFALSFNMTPEMKEAIQNGQITSVISHHEQNWGRLLIDYLLRAAQGEHVPPFIDTGTEVVQGLSSE
ncbi:substrate-binding domain-containing protein [Paenibacillus woosongensis]|uniref:Substrate-binding domain-containing protein n=1 Tax=Paenibacillus woosongensis TaxID=307580 RepID=A0AA95KUQ5_9BACL|nr:substrate-binding domain-containing protein [Paenibacillus woosongensis]WHX50273.1 substrate-binding domain-containing protein [Paenibacillus woosongensis]